MAPPTVIVGFDIGGVNTKAARVRAGAVEAAVARPFELQRDPARLASLLRELLAELGWGGRGGSTVAVTMTAELSQMFRTKREGVAFVLDAVEAACAGADVLVFAADGRFLAPAAARAQPLAVAAANWAATARVVAGTHPDAILVDVGTTTTDIIPIAAGRVVAEGWTDPARLASGELVYSGAVRTPVEAICATVPLGDGCAATSAEAFALVGDVHLWRGNLPAEDYSVTPPDGRPATREFAGERLARLVCADREMLDEPAITRIADAVAAEQVRRIADAIRRVVVHTWGEPCRLAVPTRRVRATTDGIPPDKAIPPAVVTGLGAFIAEAAARQAGLGVVRLADALGRDAARVAPAAAVALLLEGERAGMHGTGVARTRRAPGASLDGSPPGDHVGRSAQTAAVVDVVVKIGGSLMAHPAALDAVLAAATAAAARCGVLIVPGGGPFADAVREADRRFALSDDTAHWMAVLGMDQYAHLLAARAVHGALVTSLDEAARAAGNRRVPVLAPYALLRAADPLPHAWAVTSDSLAAWIAGQAGARALVVVKAPGADGDLVDPFFARALPPGVRSVVVAAEAAPAALDQMAGSVKLAFDTT